MEERIKSCPELVQWRIRNLWQWEYEAPRRYWMEPDEYYMAMDRITFANKDGKDSIRYIILWRLTVMFVIVQYMKK